MSIARRTLVLFHLLVLRDVEAALADLVEKHQVVAGAHGERAASVRARGGGDVDLVRHLLHGTLNVRHHSGEAAALRMRRRRRTHGNLGRVERAGEEGGIDAAVRGGAHHIAGLVVARGRRDKVVARHIVAGRGGVILDGDDIILTLLREGRVQLNDIAIRGHPGRNR